jgi:1,4-alpha-glucan branching enzyme
MDMAKTLKGGRQQGRRLKFSVRLPQAEEVVLTGDFVRWDPAGIPLHHHGQGDEWSATIELAPGEHEYRLRVDGEWRDDPDAQRKVPNPFGTENGVLKVE